MAIQGVQVPRAITPLSWTFRDIIAAFNNFPALNELYSFRDAIGEREAGVIVGNVPDSPGCGCGCSFLG